MLWNNTNTELLTAGVSASHFRAGMGYSHVQMQEKVWYCPDFGASLTVATFIIFISQTE